MTQTLTEAGADNLAVRASFMSPPPPVVGEATCAGLRWHDVDMKLATPVVARSISDAGPEVSVKDTKTHQARRIALDPSTVEVLKRHRQLAKPEPDPLAAPFSPLPTSGLKTSTPPPSTGQGATFDAATSTPTAAAGNSAM